MGVKESQSGRGKRLWTVVPPPWQLDDGELLAEWLQNYTSSSDERETPDELLGAHLWTLSVATRVWTATSNRRRAGLFERRRRGQGRALVSGEGVPVALRCPLVAFEELYSSPGTVSPKKIRDACEQVAIGAEAEGKLLTAVSFAEAAAKLAYTNPAPANNAARLCRECGLRQRAEIWYQRVIGLSRAGRDAASYIDALSEKTGMSSLVILGAALACAPSILIPV